VVITALLIILSVYAWQRRHLPGASLFAAASLLAALWIGGSIMEYAAVDLATKVWWYKFEVVWMLPTVTAMSCFVLEYAWPGRWVTRRNLVLLFVPSLLMVFFILTNDTYHLMWVSLTQDGVIAPVRGLGNWANLFYTYALTVVEIAALVWLFVRSPLHRWPVTIVLLTKVGARATYLLKALGITSRQMPSDVRLIGVTAIMYAVALFGFRMFDPVTQARQRAVAQMRDGMVVLDVARRVANINPAAQDILGLSGKPVIGRSVGDLPIEQPALSEALAALPAEWTEISLGKETATRHILLAASALKDFRDLTTGHLVLLRDVTAERQAQARAVEQHRTLATLLERERLARELHDSLGQTLAAAHLQAGTAKLLIGQGSIGEANQCLDLLAQMTMEAEVDVREYILGIRTLVAAEVPFFSRLRQYLASFGQHCGIDVRMSIAAELEHRGFASEVETQLLRIVQEAANNIRKHAHARNVWLTFAVAGSTLQVTIADDGQGFDPATVTSKRGEGFGLQTMRERAESLGGALEIASAPGQGTQLIVHVPLKELSRHV